jgi:hypothetical protein
MDKEQKEEFDAQLDSIRYAEEIAEQERQQRRELARLNAHVGERP